MEINKINITLNADTKIEYYGEEIEPEITIRGKNGFIEIFGTKEELENFAKDLYLTVVKPKEEL